MDIRTWVRTTFDNQEPKLFLELGANDGYDTVWMAAIPNVTLHAIEPDNRVNFPGFRNVTLHRVAIGNFNGTTPFFRSEKDVRTGEPWHYSSSIRKPKAHLDHFAITFGEPTQVECITLDTFCEQNNINSIDFIWADIQGAERDLIEGGSKMLGKTRYLYTEFNNAELYDGQINLEQILKALPAYEIVELYECDVLLKNKKW